MAGLAIRTIILTGCLFGAVQAGAQENLRIGVVNVAQLLEQAPQAQAAMEALQEEFAPRQRDILAIQQSLQTKGETLQRDGAVMGEAERVNLERDIRDEQRDLEREQSEYLEDLNIRRNEELSRLQRSLLQEVQTFARSAGYDLVVSEVLFYSSAVDITDEVLQGLEASYTSETGP